MRASLRVVAWLVLLVLPPHLWAAASHIGGLSPHVHEPLTAAAGHAHPHPDAHADALPSQHRVDHAPAVTHRHESGLAGVVFVTKEPTDAQASTPERRLTPVLPDSVPAVPWRMLNAPRGERYEDLAHLSYRSWIPMPIERPPR